MVLLLTLALGCGGPPSEPPPPDAAPVWYRIELGGVPIGREERRDVATADERVVWRQRRYLLTLDGADQEVVVTSRAVLALEGPVRAVDVTDAAGTRSWQATTPDIWLLELASPEEGTVAALDPATLTVTEAHVHGEGFTVEGTRWHRQGDDLVSGALALRRVQERPALVAVDPVALLSRPARGVDEAAARRARVAVFEVDGEPVEVRVPLALELPAGDRARLTALVDRVRSRVSWRPRPARPDGMAALARGSGDCKDQADAWVQLASQEGLEARAVGGLVWLDGPQGPGLYPHAWAEAHIHGAWVPVDPTLGQVPADATHLPLAPGRVLSAEVELRSVR